MPQTMQGLIAETNTLGEEARRGDLALRGDPTKFQGAYHHLVAGINASLDALLAPTDEKRSEE